MTEPRAEGLPVGAYVASALMAANYGGDSGEDVDRFLDELAKRGCQVVADSIVDRAFAATPPQRAALDVEALERALRTRGPIAVRPVAYEWAEIIAAEYARITAEEQG